MPVSSPLLNNAFGKENRMTTAEDLANRFVKVSQEILTGSRNELYFDMHYPRAGAVKSFICCID